MIDSFKYTNDPPFWFLLAIKSWEEAEVDLISIFDLLNKRAAQLELPIAYRKEEGLSWAVICQLFMLSRLETPTLNKWSFFQMMLGFTHAFIPNNFPRIGFKRILKNTSSPTFPGRTLEDSVADTFLVNGLTFIDQSKIDPMKERIILSKCLSDYKMLLLGKITIAPSPGLWEKVTEDYSKRRPGFFRRVFRNPNLWLFDKQTLKNEI